MVQQTSSSYSWFLPELYRDERTVRDLDSTRPLAGEEESANTYACVSTYTDGTGGGYENPDRPQGSACEEALEVGFLCVGYCLFHLIKFLAPVGVVIAIIAIIITFTWSGPRGVAGYTEAHSCAWPVFQLSLSDPSFLAV
jgi:hypothetical protein